MGKVLYSFTTSLDGFIAGPGGDMSWLTPFAGAPGDAARELMDLSGALLIGRTTFGGDDPNRGDAEHEGPFGGAWSGPQFVLTHRPPAQEVPGIAFLSDLDAALAAATAAAGDRYVNVLGADVARQCLEAGVLDELFLIVAPVLLGDGTRIFSHPGGMNVGLEPLRVWCEGQLTVMRLRVRR